MDKIWYKSYDPGVPHTINPDQFSSLIQVLEDSFKRYPDKPCFMNFGESITYSQLDSYSQAFSGYLQTECGLKKGERILMMMPSILQYPVAMFGAIRAGLIVVNANPLSTYKELNTLLKKTKASCVVIFENFAYLLEPAMTGTDVQHVIYTRTGDLFPFFKGKVANFVAKNIKKVVPKWHIRGAIEFTKTIKSKYQRQFKKVIVDLTDVAFIQLSGGRKTGWENCVMLTHRNIIANMLQCSSWLESFFRHRYTGGMINPFPFSQMLSMMISLSMMRVGFTIILITNPRDINSFVESIKKTSFSMIIGLTSIYNALLKNEGFRQLDFSNLKFSFSEGMAIPKAIAEKWQALTGCPITQGYGLIEASAAVAVMPFSSRKFTGKVGLPLPSTEVKICDENGQELGINEIGELWVKGPQVMRGYWNDPEKTKKILTEDGWLLTGDMVTIDENGYLSIIDRKEDIIEVQRKKVYAIEVEEVLSSIQGVFESAVILYKPENSEPVIKAVIVRSDLNLTEENIIQECREKLKDYQIPNIIEFRAGLPKSFVGYVLRHVLREESAQVKLKSM